MREEEQIANLLVLMGPESVSIDSQFEFDEAEDTRKKILRNVMSVFDQHF